MSNAACSDPVSYTKITELRSRSDLPHGNSYQQALPKVFRDPEQEEVWKTCASILCHKAVLINFSLALLPVFLKAFFDDPGFVVKRRPR